MRGHASTRGFSADEMERLDRLFGEALLDDDLEAHLLQRRDDSFLERYNLSAETLAKLSSLRAATLHQLAFGVYMAANPQHNAAL